jgi:hypothetical protein
MATAPIPYNPYGTTNAPNTFGVTSTGYVVGCALDSPAIRNDLAGGILDIGETLPMWGGVAISELIPSSTPTGPLKNLGGSIQRATTLTLASAKSLTGFSVFDQNYSAVSSPFSRVPLIGTYGQVNFYRVGSGARIPVAVDPSLITMEGGLITQNVSWDFATSRLQPYVASGPTEAVTSMTWSATNGGQVAVVMAAPAIYNVGDTINPSGVTNTGTGAVSLINTAQTINTWTDSTHFTFLLPGNSTLWGTLGGTIVLNVGIGALSSLGIRVLEVQVGNCMTVSYNAATGAASWNLNDNCAVLLI